MIVDYCVIMMESFHQGSALIYGSMAQCMAALCVLNNGSLTPAGSCSEPVISW